MESNISFSSNVDIIQSTSQRTGDPVFLKKITDYDALMKLRRISNGSMNSKFHVFSSKQIEVISPEFKYCGYYVERKKDPAIFEKNEELNKEYGYCDYDESKLFPLLGDIQLDERESIWKTDKEFWWKMPGYYYHGDDSENKIGKWEEAGTQQGTVEKYGGGSLFTTYIKKEIEKAANTREEHIPIETVEFPELSEPDPYYYIYQKTAGVKREDTQFEYENKEAQAYLQKYGFYSAFKLVEQTSIITANSSENIIVDAGPGTGKTYTLMQKINYMVESQDPEVDPEGILVLCFTNAAVAEIKKRRDEHIKEGGNRGLRKVDIRTFHSFAWWLINEANSVLIDDGWKPVDMSKLSYDSSIVVATRIIRRFKNKIMGGWEHFIVDEIQDLTDVRAKFVLEILKGCLDVGCGFTVLGDSCQSIYDYNVENIIDPMGSQKFYRLLFSMLYGKASFYKLGLNHRQTEALISMTTELREAILNEKIPAMQKAVKKLHSRMNYSVGTYLFNEIVNNRISSNNQICLLCRNNGQVLRLSAYLRKMGIHHLVNVYDHNRCYASWIGRVFFDFDKEMISYEEFEQRYSEGTDIVLSSGEVWDRMANMLNKPDNLRLGVNELLKAIYMSQIDDVIFNNHEESNIIVSNIHKAKGREYESVLVQDSFIKKLNRNDIDIGEFKTLYVAVTRPKKQLLAADMISGDGARLVTIFKTQRKRWAKYVNRAIKFMEIRGNTDIDIDSYQQNGKDVQKYISSQVKVGDEIILRKSKPNEIFRYDIWHLKDGHYMRIGSCTEMLEEDLEVLTKTEDRWQWPYEIRELYVSNVYTHIEEQITKDDSIKAEGNIWNWVDFCGFGHLVYDSY